MLSEGGIEDICKDFELNQKNIPLTNVEFSKQVKAAKQKLASQRLATRSPSYN